MSSDLLGILRGHVTNEVILSKKMMSATCGTFYIICWLGKGLQLVMLVTAHTGRIRSTVAKDAFQFKITLLMIVKHDV